MASCPRAREDIPRPRINLCLSLMPGLFLSSRELPPYRAADASQPENGVTYLLCPWPSRLDSPCTIGYAAGVNTLILVPSSAHGNQMVAFEELIAAFQRFS